MNEQKLNDYADNLLVLNKITIDKLCSLDEAFNCIALYVFYYKTAKWQKTDTVKANDIYVEKTLKIGKVKLTKTKKILQDNGLIEIIQKRENGKVEGWYIRVHFLVNDNLTKEIKVETINNHQNEQVENSTSGKQDTNALRINIKCLKKKIEVLKEENNKLKSLLKERKKSEYSDDDKLKLEKMETYKEIVNYMNTVNEHHSFNTKIPFSYKPNSKATQKLINARLREGYNIEEFKDVIWWGYRKFVELEFQTQNGESSYKYFRPSTIFSQGHFEEYLNEYRANTI